LLHKAEIIKLCEKVNQKGLTLVPLKIYFKDALLKMELGLCQGKHTYDKKRSLMEKDLNREKERQIKNYK
jgi:SsrA-binding protein